MNADVLIVVDVQTALKRKNPYDFDNFIKKVKA
jgi:hypothetical protein